MPHTRRSGLRVYFRDVGDGPPLVLVHGYTGSGWSNWVATGWVDALAPERRLLIPDLRGHGRSQKPWRTEAYSIELLAADVVAAMDAAGIERPAIFGYSMGGMVAMHLLLHHQERFTRAVIGGMGSYFPPNRGRYVLDRPTRGAESGRWTLGRRARFLAGYASLADPVALDRVFRGVFRDQPPVDPSRLAEIQVPVLVAAGTVDRFFEPALDLSRRIPGARFVPLPNEGHISALRNPRLFAAVKEFLRDEPLAPRRGPI